MHSRVLKDFFREKFRNLLGILMGPLRKLTEPSHLSKPPKKIPATYKKKLLRKLKNILSNEKSQNINSNTQIFKSKLTNANVLIFLGLHSMPKALWKTMAIISTRPLQGEWIKCVLSHQVKWNFCQRNLGILFYNKSLNWTDKSLIKVVLIQTFVILL